MKRESERRKRAFVFLTHAHTFFLLQRARRGPHSYTDLHLKLREENQAQNKQICEKHVKRPLLQTPTNMAGCYKTTAKRDFLEK